jgi:hypothetical protein
MSKNFVSIQTIFLVIILFEFSIISCKKHNGDIIIIGGGGGGGGQVLFK